ncbi:hypothetical protein BT93_A1012 [Corymbia citriodora subsp. variegata]|nr:hypothetical protein BT93_A1012 [Corymbia citriodora subsp. variegata]
MPKRTQSRNRATKKEKIPALSPPLSLSLSLSPSLQVQLKERTPACILSARIRCVAMCMLLHETLSIMLQILVCSYLLKRQLTLFLPFL